MKKLLLCALLTIAISCSGSALYAQMQDNSGQRGGHGMAMSPEERLQRLTQQLNLTDEQQQKIKPILEDESQQIQTLRQDSSLSQPEKFGKMREIRRNTMSQIKPILNPEQQKTLEAMENRHMPERAPGALGPTTPPPAPQGPPPQQ